MTELDPNSYWQRKATFERLDRAIPDFKDLKEGDSKQYFDDTGELHFEVTVNPNNRLKSKFGKVIDYVQGEMISKPSSQIVMESTPYEIAHYVAFAVLDFFAKELTIGYGLNELVNTYDDVTLIDHKNNEVHRFSGSIENGQLRYEASHNLDDDLLSKGNLDVRFEQDERIDRNFSDFLGKLTPAFKARFAGEKEERVLSNA